MSIEIPLMSEAAARLFACMSRFEFALKEAGYVDGEEGKRASPGWSGFDKVVERSGALDRLKANEAIRPLFDEPPRKQLRKDDGVVWSDPMPVKTFAQFSLAMRQVRNNLFHGGKAGADARDDILCDAASTALLELLHVDVNVCAAFEGQY